MSTTLRTVLVVTALLLAATVGSSGAAPMTQPASPQLIEALQKDLSDYLSRRASVEHISTLSMSVSFHDGSNINMAVGTTQYGGGTPVTPSNLFQIGSNTKSYTSAILLRLEAAGALSIDDTLGKWLPQYPAWKNVTIRQLLNMTSGIPTYDNTPAQIADYGKNPNSSLTPDKLVAYVYPTIKTRAGFEYSNTGYELAQMIIDKASPSHSYATELDNLIASLGLKDTFYQPYFYPPSVTQRLVSGYYVNTDPPVIAPLLGKDTSRFSLDWTQAAGGMVGTPDDLTRWVRALFEGDVLPPKQLAELETLVAIPSGQPIMEVSAANPQAFGLGVFQIYEPTIGTMWGYQGSTIGYRAAYGYIPASGLIICVFTNSQPAAALSTMNTVLFETLYKTLKAGGRT